jgi:PAS domain S-box-containing protein
MTPDDHGVEHSRQIVAAMPAAGNDVGSTPTLGWAPLTCETLFQALGDNAYELDHEFCFLTFNSGCEAYYGIPAQQALNRPIWEVLAGTRGSELEQQLRTTMASRRPVRVEMAGIVRPGRWIEVTLFPTARGLGVAFRDRTAERRAERALRESEERLRLAQSAGEVGSWDWDLGTGELHWSESCHRLHGTDPSLPPSMDAWRNGIHADDRKCVDQVLRAALEGSGANWSIEFRFSRRSDGALRWIAARGSIIRDAMSGEPMRLLGVVLDLTERREAEERQSLLARELDHRAKNALAVVQAAVRLTPKDDAAAFARMIEGRVGALARAHTLLAEARWSGAELRALAQAELTAFLPSRGAAVDVTPRAMLDGPSIRLGPAATQALSMALHELATNAVKYGALSQPDGQLCLSWKVDLQAGLLRLRWSEVGGPPVAGPPSRSGFGTRVIRATLCDQLGGRLNRSWEPGGLVCEIDIPVERAVAPGGTAESLPAAL